MYIVKDIIPKILNNNILLHIFSGGQQLPVEGTDTNKLRDLNTRENHTDRETAACRRS
jgi:hypothetical protein